MTTLSELFPRSAVESIQTGFVDTTLSTGSGETAKYLDVTISAVVVANCVMTFDGSFGTNTTTAGGIGYGSAANYFATSQLTSTTNLRLGAPDAGMTYITGRWTVVEYK